MDKWGKSDAINQRKFEGESKRGFVSLTYPSPSPLKEMGTEGVR
jgi:hypothetical protein